MTAPQEVKTLVLGIGNLLIGDEGVGCRTVAELNRRYSLPASVECVDGGTAGFELLGLLDNREQVILIDALQDGREPGAVIRVEGEHVPRAFLIRTTPHQLGICDVLATAQLTGTMPKHLTLYGIEPKQLDVGIGLSPEVEAGMEKTIRAVVDQLRHIGYEVKHNGIESAH
ncbi:HyaD/HybD family hydrogenase maturation endopeptidase [Desulfobulbus oligotrophicus]|uniref:HyaD/HybD family hydrogenase maturation endopeptidase n=1 Tax=Desulfobulbus oligotrophicus TaxID=1909699 RepID=A0A7T5VAY0_9BACT|nr:HyaD/HybD family hydrogenase maturation endopeptidase [Desulfobulbus oligotrophicus]MDY0390954.1 HyaD/HybD family hydrogenase maturation endopeptidase [Desulfobulbus oligotrophicus]QQG64528.1 HyaD/HybD family hydrogenase maturation endopeptidase [Desulfobulbus oligotrophicus]